MRSASLVFILLLPLSSFAGEVCVWPQWESFKTAYIENGRVVDRSDARQITTSEGQSYGMFFALVANDRASFDQLLRWTQTELAAGDLGSYLPAWLWGHLDQVPSSRLNRPMGVIDNNSASDSDLWIAYSLIEAGRLWNHYYYTSLGYLLLEQIRRYEVVDVPGLGLSVLPAPKGFGNGDGKVRLNPSYVPLQILDRFAELYPEQDWQEISAASLQLILQSMPKGYSSNWVEVDAGRGVKNLVLGEGSYDAIRNYLWAGMLSDANPNKARIAAVMKPMALAVEKNAAPPEKIDTATGNYSGAGPFGFSAAMLPFLAQYNMSDVLNQQRRRANQGWDDAHGDSRYYNSVLSLFGLGWDQGYFQFAENGALLPAWQSGCLP